MSATADRGIIFRSRLPPLFLIVARYYPARRARENMLLLNQSPIERLGTMRECIEVIDVTMREVARKLFDQPPRQVLSPAAGTIFGIMPGACAAYGIFGAKLIAVSQHPSDLSLASHQGAVVLFDRASGALSAILDAGSITALRTAAASAVATRCLARPDSRVLALIGSGHQAHKHLEAMRLVRPIERVVIWSRTAAHAQRFAQHHRTDGLPVTVARTAREAVEEADVICTLTSSADPVLRGEWLTPGQHINAVGSGVAGHRELDEEAVRRSKFFADCSDFVRDQGGEYIAALRAARVTRDHLLGDIGAVLDGQIAGRTSPRDITVYKSLGLIAQDIACSRHLVLKALEIGGCPDVPFASYAH